MDQTSAAASLGVGRGDGYIPKPGSPHLFRLLLGRTRKRTGRAFKSGRFIAPHGVGYQQTVTNHNVMSSVSDIDPAETVRKSLRSLAESVLKSARLSPWDIVRAPSEDELQKRQDAAIRLANEIDALADSALVRPISEQELQTLLVTIKALTPVELPADAVEAVLSSIKADTRLNEPL